MAKRQIESNSAVSRAIRPPSAFALRASADKTAAVLPVPHIPFCAALLVAALIVTAPLAFCAETPGKNGKRYKSEVFEGEPENHLPIPKLAAFPGAEGYGARSLGGRGGRVIKVTNLKADGPGSLQWACAQKGPRIIVFEVSGVIPCSRSSKGKKFLAIDHPHITIAGQTAPGAGITIEGGISTLRGYSGARKQSVDNVIIRFMRARPKPTRTGNIRSMEMSGSNRVILDHVSGCWSLDDCFDLYTTRDVTVQWCAAEESDIQLEGGDEPHDFGMIFGYGHRAKTIHHTLLANHRHRNPLVGTYPTDFRNNVVHNGGNSMNYIIKGSIAEQFIMNIVGNYSSHGPGGLVGERIYQPPYTYGHAGFSVGRSGKFYRVGNYHPWSIGYLKNGTTDKRYAARYSEREFKFPPVETHTAEEARRLVVAHAGCLPRDVVGRRTIREVLSGTGGWGRFGPADGLMSGLKAGKAPADGDGDGMPDAWEKAHGLNPADATDAIKVVPASASPADRHKGYTWIEYYINDLADQEVAEALTVARFKPEHTEPWDQPADELAPVAKQHASLDAIIAAIKAQTPDKGRGTGPAWYAVQQLSRMGEKAAPAVPELIKLVEDQKELRIATFAVWALGAIGPPAKSAVPALIKASDTKYSITGKAWKPWFIQGFIAWALGRIGPDAKAGVPTLVKIMQGRCLRSHRPAAWALSRMGPDASGALDPLLKALSDGGARWHAARALANIGEPAIPGLTAVLKRNARGTGHLAADALGLMGAKGKNASAALIEALSGKDANLRRSAAQALGRIGPDASGAAEALATALTDPDFNVRHAAAHALGMLGAGAKDAIDPLAKAASDERREVARSALLSLGKIGEASVPKLAALLEKNANAFARKYAARALGEVRPASKSAVGPLQKALTDKDADVRREAVWSLGLIGSVAADAKSDLDKAAKDSDYVVRFAASEALKRVAAK